LTSDCLIVDEKPDAVLVNYNNWGYCRPRFDKESLGFFINNLKYMSDDCAMRTYIWRTFKDMIQSNELSISEWYRLIGNNLEFETEEQTMVVVLGEILKTYKNGLFSDE